MTSKEERLLTRKDLEGATEGQLIELLDALNGEFERRGMGGVVRREPDDLEPTDPANPVDA